MKVAFDGTAYHGWQIQHGATTIQGMLSEVIEKITGEKTTVTGSGRTDAGVHARGLVANFFTSSFIEPARFARALNSILPRDVRILSSRAAPETFHARKSALSKSYRYQMYLRSILPPHLLREYLHYPYRIDFPKMEAAAKCFLGERDFASFTKANHEYLSTVRRIYRCELKKRGRRMHLTVVGNGFMRHMVRNMAGTLLEVGRGSISLEDFKALFDKRDRTLAGFTAPAHGLVLLKVNYPKE
jgi:tRNA pseudouridine38-40 synthase